MTEETYTLDFDKPIEFNLTIEKMEEVETIEGKQIWIEGIGEFREEIKKTVFYCPSGLEYILRDLNIEEGDKIFVMYLGWRRKGRRIQEFYAKKLEIEEKNE